jgi:pyruvate/2-oxoglutarate/acetoin dehydrogenase E1 component
MREITFAKALNEATDLCMSEDPNVFIMGLGVPDPKAIFGSTAGLQKKYGEARVFDIPCAENAMTGIAIGSALTGKRPILTHQRIDFALLSVEQLVNQAAKWHYMFGAAASVPLVIRMIIGRGWGQGPQHSQSLQALFAHIPGLKVVMPTTAFDAKGLLIASIRDNNPVIFLEHRWLYNLTSHVPEESYEIPLGKARIVTEGKDITVVTSSHMTVEAIKASSDLEKEGIHCEILDLRSIRPLDKESILSSVRKTGRLLVLDSGWTSFGISAEIMAMVCENEFKHLKCSPQRIALPDIPTPTSHALAQDYYPTSFEISDACRSLMGAPTLQRTFKEDSKTLDIPDSSFTGPF